MDLATGVTITAGVILAIGLLLMLDTIMDWQLLKAILESQPPEPAQEEQPIPLGYNLPAELEPLYERAKHEDDPPTMTDDDWQYLKWRAINETWETADVVVINRREE